LLFIPCIFLHSIFLKSTNCTNCITIKYITKHCRIRFQLLHVLSPKCRHQGASQQRVFVVTTCWLLQI
jgi:hypothetical protein